MVASATPSSYVAQSVLMGSWRPGDEAPDFPVGATVHSPPAQVVPLKSGSKALLGTSASSWACLQNKIKDGSLYIHLYTPKAFLNGGENLKFTIWEMIENMGWSLPPGSRHSTPESLVMS